MLRSGCFKLYRICRIMPITHHKRCLFNIPMRYIEIAGRDANNNNNNKDMEWSLLCEYAHRSNLLKFNYSEIRDWLKVYDNNIDIDSMKVREVKSCGQKYITYLTNGDNGDDLYQYVVVRGTKNWKNIKTSLQYTVNYNHEFQMYLHNGYGNASHAVLQDLKQFIHPNAKLNLTGHSYGGIVCCCIASNLQRTAMSQINQIVTFGMPQFSNDKQMKIINDQLPVIQVRHIRDEIAKFDWNRIINKRNNKQLQFDDDDDDKDNDYNIIYIGDSSLKKRFVHRMGDYVQSIEKHIVSESESE